MANYTLTTNAKQEAVLDKIRAREKNPDSSPKYTNNQQMLSAYLQDWLKSYKIQLNIEAVAVIKAALDDKWDDITKNERNQIETILGLPPSVSQI